MNNTFLALTGLILSVLVTFFFLFFTTIMHPRMTGMYKDMETQPSWVTTSPLPYVLGIVYGIVLGYYSFLLYTTRTHQVNKYYAIVLYMCLLSIVLTGPVILFMVSTLILPIYTLTN